MRTSISRRLPLGPARNAKPWMLLVLMVAAVGGAVLLIPATESRESESQAFELRWPHEHELVYRLVYSARQRVALGVERTGEGSSPGLTGRLDVNARLVVRDIGIQEHDRWIGFRLEDIQTLDLEIAGAQPFAAVQDIEQTFGNNAEAVAVLEPNGILREIRVAPDAPPLFLTVMRQLLQETSFTTGKGASWVVEERTPYGVARSSYRVVERAEIVRSRPDYVSLDALAVVPSHGATRVTGEARFTFSKGGWLRRLHGTEHITAGPSLAVDSEITLELAELRALSGKPVVVETIGYQPDQAPVTEQVRQNLLEQRIAGRTLEDLSKELRTWGDVENPPGLADFLWQATGYLTLHPEACRELAPLFREKGASSKRRARILDLLANVGHAQAQDVMRTLLALQETKADPRYVFMFQRLSLLEKPDEKTLGFVRDTFESSEGDPRLAAMYALGSVAAGRSKQGDEESSREVDERLRRELRDAADDSQRIHALRALAAVGSPLDVPLIAAHASSTDSSVRTVVALSLRNLQTPEAEHVLLDLASDGDAQVQRAALSTLNAYTLTPEHLEALQNKVATASIVPEAYQELFLLMRDVGERNQDFVTNTARQMLANGIPDPEVRVRVQSLLGSG